MLLNKADVIKFSGQEATQAELEEAYTTVETVFESHLAQAKKEILENQEAQSQKKKRFRLK
jgi:histidinol dehydrogenase